MAKTFLKTKEATAVLLVDALNLSFRWKHSGAVEFVQEYINTVKSLARSYNCAKIILAADKGSSSYRLGILPEYKGNRKILRENQTEAEKQAFVAFIEEYERTLLEASELEGIPVLRYQDTEADDIAAYIVKHREELGITRIQLISTDRDWDLLLSPKVSRFSYVTRKEYSTSNWQDHYEVPQEEYITLKCLTGDKGDNVPGVPGIGPKRALGLIQQYGSIFDIYSSLPIKGTQKWVQNLNASGDQLLQNIELMDLLTTCDDIIGNNDKDITAKLARYIYG